MREKHWLFVSFVFSAPSSFWHFEADKTAASCYLYVLRRRCGTACMRRRRQKRVIQPNQKDNLPTVADGVHISHVRYTVCVTDWWVWPACGLWVSLSVGTTRRAPCSIRQSNRWACLPFATHIYAHHSLDVLCVYAHTLCQKSRLVRV